MILTRHEIKQLLGNGGLTFTPPLDVFQDQPHAVDLRLGTTFYLPRTWRLTEKGREIVTVDVTEKAGDNYEQIELKMGQYFELAPGESIIASTLERIEMNAPDIMGVLYPRSSINRRGLSVDLTGIVDAHYSGHLMVPILNKTARQVIRIMPGERICQLVFERLEQPLERADALRHGVASAKYTDATAESLCNKQDDQTEVELIRSGNLEGLKKRLF